MQPWYRWDSASIVRALDDGDPGYGDFEEDEELGGEEDDVEESDYEEYDDYADDWDDDPKRGGRHGDDEWE